ncbi:hypothetical protein MRX96_047975 [Rhipicephalus microplus]
MVAAPSIGGPSAAAGGGSPDSSAAKWGSSPHSLSAQGRQVRVRALAQRGWIRHLPLGGHTLGGRLCPCHVHGTLVVAFEVHDHAARGAEPHRCIGR